MNTTATKFGYPDSLIHKLEHWSILLRPTQVTLGSLVLVCHEPVGQFGQISSQASTELGKATTAIEDALGRAFSFDRINYLMLMMVDPDVHFHVLPRYEAERQFEGVDYSDGAWPGPPDITASLGISSEAKAALLTHLRGLF